MLHLSTYFSYVSTWQFCSSDAARSRSPRDFELGFSKAAGARLQPQPFGQRPLVKLRCGMGISWDIGISYGSKPASKSNFLCCGWIIHPTSRKLYFFGVWLMLIDEGWYLTWFTGPELLGFCWVGFGRGGFIPVDVTFTRSVDGLNFCNEATDASCVWQ